MDQNNMDVWSGNWSSSDSDETGSSYSDDSVSSHRMEAVKVGGEGVLLPQGLCDKPEVFRELLSSDTWNALSDQDKEHLKNFLPSFPENDEEEKQKTLEMLFNRDNFKFGNPLTDFHKQLKAGFFRPDVRRMRTLLRKAQYKDYKRSERWRLFDLVKSVLASRQRLVDAVVNGEKPKVLSPSKKAKKAHDSNVKSRYFQELALIKEEVGESSDSSEDENYPEGPGTISNKKNRRQAYLVELSSSDGFVPVLGTLCSGSSPWEVGKYPQSNPYTPQEQSYSQLLTVHSRRRANKEDHPDLYTDGVSLHDIAQRCKQLKRTNHTKPIISKKVKTSQKVVRTPSISSPMLEEEMDDTSGTEETVSTLMCIKQDTEEELDKVDIEAVDEISSLPPSIKVPNSIPQVSSPKNNKVSMPKRIKQEPFETPPRKPSIELSDPQVMRKPKIEPVVLEAPKKPVIKAEPPEFNSKKHLVSDPIETSPKKVPQPEVIEAPVQSIKVETFESPLQMSPVPPVFSVSPTMAKTMGSRVLTPATLSDLDGIDMMDLPVDIDESSLTYISEEMKAHPELMQDTHACFFSLIRDILTSTPDHRIEMKELEIRVKAWANSPIGPLNLWYTPHIESQLTSAVHFLAGDQTVEILPEDYVPYMEWKSSCGAYQWIGAGRDSDHRLIALCNLWLERGADRGVNAPPIQSTTPCKEMEPITPSPRGPAVQPTSPKDREVFRQQEKLRYENPYSAFTYIVNGVETVVGPVRTVQSGNNSKARGHSLLVDNRPKCVTILELVRDAVSRLPNAQGTRADIVTLLKDSQYLLETAQENMLSSVVSGVLDRLHYEHDPSVKYDTKRKIWVYLHRGRTAEEFERLHALGADMRVSRPKTTRKPAKPKKEIQKAEVTLSDSAVNESTAVISSDQGIMTIPTSALPESSTPLIVQTTTPKPVQKTGQVPSVTTKKVITEGVKSLLGKNRVKVQEGAQVPQQQLIRVQQQVPSAVQATLKRPTDVQKTVATSSLLPTRTIDTATLTIPVTHPNLVKKIQPQSVTISADQLAKQGGKSIVKVITTTQPTTVASAVRTVQRAPTINQQQVIQLKQQLLADQKLVQKGGVKKTTMPAQQQLIVMKQAGEQGSSNTQQMIIVNQQQVVMDSQQLSAKQQKQIQHIITKQQLDQQQGNIQQQLQQLILTKQQIVTDQQKAGKPQQQMIVVKQQAGSVQGADGVKQPLQQMILVKQTSQGGEGQGETQQVTQQQLQQMLLLKQQQQQQQQQMIIVKQQDQKSVQVITQSQAKTPTQQVTLAQLQQLQQQRSPASTSLLTHPRVVAHAVRLPTVSRAGITSQYAVVSMPQQRVVTQVSQAPTVSTVMSVNATVDQGPKIVTTTTTSNVRIPGLNLAQIAGKQVLLASKPQTIQGQNVLLGNSGGQTVLVGSPGGQQGTLTVLQQGSQQILIPPGALKALQGLKVIPITQGKQAQAQPGRQQVFARIINPGPRPVLTANIVQDPSTSSAPPTPNSKEQ